MATDERRRWSNAGLTVIGLEGPFQRVLTLFIVICVLDFLGISLLERPLTIAAMAAAALGLTNYLMRPRAVATVRSRGR